MTEEDAYLRDRDRWQHPMPHGVSACKGQWEITVRPWRAGDGTDDELKDMRLLCRACRVCHLVKASKPGADEDAPPVPVPLQVFPEVFEQQPEAFPTIKVAGLELVPTRILLREPFDYDAKIGDRIVGFVSQTRTERGAIRWTCRALRQDPTGIRHKTPRAAGMELAKLLAGAAPQ